MSDEVLSFKERVKNVAINESKNYKRVFLDHEYLICSQVFSNKDYYIISANEDNYQHLIGINSSLSAKDFFHKCYDGTLQETDFDFSKRNHGKRSVKGTVRRKIKVLGNMMTMFQNTFFIQEQFVKNTIACSIATADNECTIGFIDVGKSIPRTLIDGNELKNNGKVDLLLRKKKSLPKFNEMLIGDIDTLKKYYDSIETLIDEYSLASGVNDTFKEVAVDSSEE